MVVVLVVVAQVDDVDVDVIGAVAAAAFVKELFTFPFGPTPCAAHVIHAHPASRRIPMRKGAVALIARLKV